MAEDVSSTSTGPPNSTITVLPNGEVDSDEGYDKAIATGYQVLGVFTWLLGWASSACALYIMRESWLLRQAHKTGALREKAPVILTNHVFWMSFCDVLQQFWIGFVWMPVGLDASFSAGWPNWACWGLGSTAQFFLVASAAWNFMIAVLLLRTLFNYRVRVIEQELPYHHAFVWGIAFVCWLAPFLRRKGVAYGYTANIEHEYGFAPFECWIEIPDYQLCLYLPAMVFVFSAMLLLLVTFVKAYQGAFTMTRQVLTRLSLYTIVFVVTWTFPIILRLRGTSVSTEPPPFLVWAHHISLAIIGMGNAIVWGTSQTMKTGQKSDTGKVKSKGFESSTKGSQPGSQAGGAGVRMPSQRREKISIQMRVTVEENDQIDEEISGRASTLAGRSTTDLPLTPLASAESQEVILHDTSGMAQRIQTAATFSSDDTIDPTIDPV